MRLLQLITARNTWQTSHLLALVVFFITLLGNIAFFRHAGAVYFPQNIPFILALGLVLLALNYFVLGLFSYRVTLKPIAAVILLLSAVVAYHMDTFDVVIDKVMLQNVVQTQTAEALDLLTPKFLVYLLVLGVLPTWWLLRQKIERTSLKRGFWLKFKWMGLALLLVALCGGVFNKSVASFAREHKAVRFYTNPLTYLYSAGQFVGDHFSSQTQNFQAIALDSKISESDHDKELMIMVVGETVRADHWSLNGYGKNTNPLMSQEANFVSLSNFNSCGTSTAVSVPCMFTNLGRVNYSDKKFNNTENALDVLKRSGVQILWRDNNSSSKGVADRVTYEDYRDAKRNPMCEGECRDEGMLVGLQEYINQNTGKDILIVLHTMGNHGPAYFKRYPKQFEKFTPACQDNQLENCSAESISNAYDNAILYTDYVLSQIIQLLKANEAKYETSMIYMSDHGESLGEKGVYLHGMPYMIAPDAQKYPAAGIWVGRDFNGVAVDKLKQVASQPLSHDHLFHTLLGAFEVQTQAYRPELDIYHLAGSDKP